VFIGLFFTGYFVVLDKVIDAKLSPIILIGISTIGFIFTFAWYFVNRGGKYWQENWEMHVDFLEDSVIGPLYKIVKNPKYQPTKLLGDNPYSVSRINHILNIVLMFVWIALFVFSISKYFPCLKSFLDSLWNWRTIQIFVVVSLLCVCIAFCVIISILGKSRFAKKQNKTHINNANEVFIIRKGITNSKEENT
jgi:hypothetical protein